MSQQWIIRYLKTTLCRVNNDSTIFHSRHTPLQIVLNGCSHIGLVVLNCWQTLGFVQVFRHCSSEEFWMPEMNAAKKVQSGDAPTCALFVASKCFIHGNMAKTTLYESRSGHKVVPVENLWISKPLHNSSVCTVSPSTITTAVKSKFHPSEPQLSCFNGSHFVSIGFNFPPTEREYCRKPLRTYENLLMSLRRYT